MSIAAAVVRQRDPAQHVEQQRRRRHLHRRRDARRVRQPDPGQRHQQQQGLRHLRPQAEPRDQGQQRPRQRQLGHLGQRGQQRPQQRRRRRQPRPGQHGPARSDHAAAAAVLDGPVRHAARRSRSTRCRRTTQILQGPTDPSNSDTAVFRFTGTDNVSDVTFQCKLDAEAFGPCESPLTLTDLAEGEHRFEVRAVDVSGNVDNTPAVHTWTIGVRDRRHGARDDDRVRARRHHREHRRDVRLGRERAQRELRVPDRQRQLRSVRVDRQPVRGRRLGRLDHVQRPLGRHAHLPGPRDRRRRQRRRARRRSGAGASPLRRC